VELKDLMKAVAKSKGDRKKRMRYVCFTRALDKALNKFCADSGTEANDIIEQAVEDYLRRIINEREENKDRR
jgi:regulator of PEP synthase PpsR (kinase-PPPase family)